MAELEQAVATRLRAVMASFGIKSNPRMAEVCGATASSVNNWLLGYNLPRVPEMIRLCEQTGLTLDWIYRGSMASMDAKLGLHLAQLIEGKRP
jgi:hypothetical protein